MKTINLTDLKIEDAQEWNTLNIEFECPDLDKSLTEIDKSVSATFSKSFKEYVNDVTFNKPIVFNIIVKNCAAKLDEYDIKSLVNVILSAFNFHFVETERREREYHFGLTYLPDLSIIKDSQLHIMKFINYKTKAENFNVLIKFETEDPETTYLYALVE